MNVALLAGTVCRTHKTTLPDSFIFFIITANFFRFVVLAMTAPTRVSGMTMNVFPTIICATLVTACSAEPEVGIEEALGVISQDSFEATAHYLADDARKGRQTGSPEYEDAARYVARQFEAMGLRQGGGDGWFQHVPFIAAEIDAGNSGVVLHTKSGDVELEWIRDAVVFPDAVRDETRVRAEVVFAGFGIHAPHLDYSDYEGIDVEGKIVATFWDGPETFPDADLAYYSSADAKAAELTRRGAVGQLLLWDRQEEEDYDWDEYYGEYPSQPPLSWINDAGEASGYYPARRGLADLSRASAEKLFADSAVTFEDALDAAEAFRPMSAALNIEVTLYQKSQHRRFESPNVIGILPGSDPRSKGEYVVVSSHLDHIGTSNADDEDTIYNGFYDNAVGIAIMLESARALSKLSVTPRRSIVFIAVTGEEDGLFGSDYFVNNPTVPADSIIANINIDMPMFLFPLNTMTIYGAASSSLGDSAATEVALEGFEVRPDPYPDEVFIGRSDQYSFALQGIPFVYLAEGVGSSDPAIDGLALGTAFLEEHYHQVSDDLSQPLDWDTARRFARATARVTRRIAMDEATPTWNKGDFFGECFGRPTAQQD